MTAIPAKVALSAALVLCTPGVTGQTRPAPGHSPLRAVVLKDFPPLYSVTATGEPQGFAIDILEQVIAGTDLQVRYQVVENWALAEQLRHSQKMEAIGQLAGGVAHDFNNLLTAIIGNAQLLEMNLPEESKAALMAHEITVASGRAGDLTRQLLSFSRKGHLQRVPANAHQIIEEVIVLLERSIDKRITERKSLEADRPELMGDPTQIQNALLNLAVNARDAMPAGGTITFSTQNLNNRKKGTRGDDPTGKCIKITVTDTGVGIPEEIQEHIFEPFFTTKKQGEGTGLGLAGAYGCIKSHKGSIQIESEEGKGTTFTILLPCKGTTDGKAEPERNNTLVSGAGHILLVDDEEIIRNVASQSLIRFGYVVTLCAGGREALELLEQNDPPIDLVILDVIMPEMSGFETYQAMIQRGIQTKVLISSGFAKTQEIHWMLDHGALGLIQKPFRMAKLSQEVAQALEACPDPGGLVVAGRG